MPPEQADNTGNKAGYVEIEPENANAVRLFLGMQSQWNWTTLSAGFKAARVRTGLRYEALPIVAAAHHFILDAALLGQIAILEDETIAVESARIRAAFGRS